MSKRSDSVKKWRTATKARIIESMGGCCQACGYAKCQYSLDLHHLDPSIKEFGFGAIRSNPKRWSKIIVELRKCVLLCKNCHGEFHGGLLTLPNSIQSFNESYADYMYNQKESLWDDCPVCFKKKRSRNKFCSLTCVGRSQQRVDWDSVDLKKMLTTTSVSGIAESLNISFAAVKKRMKKIGIEDPVAG